MKKRFTIIVTGLVAGLWCAVCILPVACVSVRRGGGGRTNWAEERFRSVGWGQAAFDSYTNALVALTAEEWEWVRRLVNPDQSVSDFTTEEQAQFAQVLGLDITNVIHTAEALAQFAHLVNLGDDFGGRVVLLAADIDLSAHQWTPAGTNNNTASFMGIFDGGGHTISGMTIKISKKNAFKSVGLFGEIRGSVIRNVTLADVNIAVSCDGKTGLNAGGIAGFNWGGRGSMISNCTVNGTISSSWAAGGIAGCSFGDITDCVNDAAVSAAVWAGGIAGWNSDAIGDCVNNGAVSCSTDYSLSEVGGIAGSNDGGVISYGTIINCLNNGVVSSFSWRGTLTGGLVGKNSGGRVINSQNRGTVSVRTDSAACEELREYGYCADSSAGGIVGRNVTGSVANCVSTGDIIFTGAANDKADVGGVAGLNDESDDIVTCITDSYWRVSGTDQAVGTIKAGTVTSNLISFGDAPGTLSSPHPDFGTASLLDALNAYVDAHLAVTNVWRYANTDAVTLRTWTLDNARRGYPTLRIGGAHPETGVGR